MPELSFKDGAAVNRIAAVLAPLVTNGIIDEVADQLELPRLQPSNKAKKIQLLLATLLADRRTHARATKAIATLTAEAHHRTTVGAASMTTADADVIVAEMRTLGLAPGELGQRAWRSGLKPVERASEPTPRPPEPRAERPFAGPRPRRHPEALEYLGQLVADDRRPQHRGRELELIIFGVLTAEALSPERNIVNPGVQIDLAFVLGENHYLVECKWEKERVGLPHVSAFSAKVARSAVGVFGVLLSMSGFVANINETASRGARLNCIGLGPREVMDVLEGRTTFAAVVREGRALASTRSMFFRSK